MARQVTYVNTSPAALLEAHPRAVYRFTLVRSGLAALNLVSWPDAVRDTLERAGYSGYGIALGGPAPASSDESAVIELRTKTEPGTADSVGDLVSAVQDASLNSEVTKVERLAPVPAAGSPEAKERASTREAEAVKADQAARADSWSARLARLGKGAGWVVGLGLAAGLVLVALIYLPRPQGGAIPGDGKVWE